MTWGMSKTEAVALGVRFVKYEKRPACSLNLVDRRFETCTTHNPLLPVSFAGIYYLEFHPTAGLVEVILWRHDSAGLIEIYYRDAKRTLIEKYGNPSFFWEDVDDRSPDTSVWIEGDNKGIDLSENTSRYMFSFRNKFDVNMIELKVYDDKDGAQSLSLSYSTTSDLLKDKHGF